MKHFQWSRQPLCNAQQWAKHVALPLLYILLITAGLVGIFATFLHFGKDMIPVITPHQDDGEWVDPNPMRLLFMLMAFVISFCFAYLAEKKSTKIMCSFLIGYTGGTLLWQSTGECAWHFSIPTDDYIMCFPHIEGASAIIMVIVASILLAYCYHRNAFSWGVWVFILSFIGNWFGHFIQIGTYPIVASLMSEGEWYILTGSIIGGTLTLLSLLMSIFFARTEKARLCTALMLYFSLGIIVTGVAGI